MFYLSGQAKLQMSRVNADVFGGNREIRVALFTGTSQKFRLRCD
jgi:hypothetical protein